MDIDDMFGLGGPSGRGANAFRSQSFHGSSPHHGVGGGRKVGAAVRQDPPIEHDLFLTLEEVLRGCVKKMKITRKVVERRWQELQEGGQSADHQCQARMEGRY